MLLNNLCIHSFQYRTVSFPDLPMPEIRSVHARSSITSLRDRRGRVFCHPPAVLWTSHRYENCAVGHEQWIRWQRRPRRALESRESI